MAERSRIVGWSVVANFSDNEVVDVRLRPQREAGGRETVKGVGGGPQTELHGVQEMARCLGEIKAGRWPK
jgi:hypothetical protein